MKTTVAALLGMLLTTSAYAAPDHPDGGRYV